MPEASVVFEDFGFGALEVGAVVHPFLSFNADASSVTLSQPAAISVQAGIGVTASRARSAPRRSGHHSGATSATSRPRDSPRRAPYQAQRCHLAAAFTPSS